MTDTPDPELLARFGTALLSMPKLRGGIFSTCGGRACARCTTVRRLAPLRNCHYRFKSAYFSAARAGDAIRLHILFSDHIIAYRGLI
jgi:hypothetical protein